MKWPILFKRFIYDGLLDQPIQFADGNDQIDKWSYGTHVESRFFEKGIFDIRLHQKPENKFLDLPAKSGHKKHTISNYVSSDIYWTEASRNGS